MESFSLQTPAWLVFLRALCALAEGAAELVNPTLHTAAAACVVAVLQDSQRRVAVLGGREAMPRSLGSFYGGSVTRFLGGFRGSMSRVIAMPGVRTLCGGVAVSRDGSALLVSDCRIGVDAVHVFSFHTGALLRTIGGPGSGPLQFSLPGQVWVASDGFVFVADSLNYRIQILTPRFEFYKFVGAGQLTRPLGVCASDDVIVATEHGGHCINVFSRNDGTLVRCFGSRGSGDGQLMFPAGVCFMAGHRHVAVADFNNNRVSVWTLKGEFLRHVGEGKVQGAMGVVCSDADELVVAARLNKCVVLFNANGEIVWASETSASDFTSVTMHGSTISGTSNGRCVVFS